jgi:hypothetical protein
MKVRHLTAIGLAVITTACQGGDLCTLSVEPSIVVTIRDASTGAPLAAGATGDAVQKGGVTKGGRTLPLVPHGFHSGVMITRRAGEEISGVFTVRVQHAGYLEWVRTGVHVPGNGCHVGTAQIVAELIPVIVAEAK